MTVFSANPGLTGAKRSVLVESNTMGTKRSRAAADAPEDPTDLLPERSLLSLEEGHTGHR